MYPQGNKQEMLVPLSVTHRPQVQRARIHQFATFRNNCCTWKSVCSTSHLLEDLLSTLSTIPRPCCFNSISMSRHQDSWGGDLRNHQCNSNYMVMFFWNLFRAHEKWELEEPPDYVTFAKKLLSGGYFFRGDESFEVRNWWCIHSGL